MAASSAVCSWPTPACTSVVSDKDASASTLSAASSSNSGLCTTRWVARRRKKPPSKCAPLLSAVPYLSASCSILEPSRHFYKSSDSFFCFESRRRRRFHRQLYSGRTMAVAVQPAMEVPPKKKPPTKQRRVVVTGMGVETPLGSDPGVFYNNLLEGVSGISEIEAFDCSQFPTRIAGEIKSFSTDGWVAPKLSKRMDKFMLYMLTAGKKALADAGITEEAMDGLNKTRCGVLIGSAMGGMKVFQDAIEALRISYRKMNPFCVPFATTNMGSAMLAMDLVA